MNIYNNSLFEITSKGKGGEKLQYQGDNLLFIGQNFLTKGQLDPSCGEKEFYRICMLHMLFPEATD